MEGSRFGSTQGAPGAGNRQSLWNWVIAMLFYVLAENAWLKNRVDEVEKSLEKLRRQTEILQARLAQDSTNSSRPPSSNSPFKKEPSTGEKGKPGARKGHPGHRQKLLDPTETLPVEPGNCPCGGREFSSLKVYYTHQEIELPEIDVTVRHFLLHSGVCTRCGRLVKARIPEGHESGFGPRLTAHIGELSIGNSRGWVQSFCLSFLGVPISRGAVQRCLDRVSEALIPHYEQISELARKVKVNFIDETPWFQNGTLMWLWVMANHRVTFFKVQASRSKAAFEALVDKWAGILVSDGYGVYVSWVNKRQSCLAHLVRRAKGLSERTDTDLAHFGKRALAELRRLIAWAHAPPTKGEVSAWFARFVHLLKSNRARKDEVGKFARHLERELGHLWVFLLEEGVEATNNRAERALRFAVLWRKTMQGTCSDKGDRLAERVLSLRETCRQNGLSTYDVLVHAVSCHFQGQKPDLTWLKDC